MYAVCVCEFIANWIIVRKRCAESTSLSLPDLAVPRGKTRVETTGAKSGCSW